MKDNLNGIEIVKSFGKGESKSELEISSIRLALRDLLFEGIRDGSGGCTKTPLLSSVNSDEYNKDFFKNFFSLEGDFKKFDSILKKNNSSSSINSYIIELKVDELKKYIKKLNLK